MLKKTLKATMAAFVLAVVGIGSAKAAPTDALTLTVTPNASYGVLIDTQAVNLALGTVDLGLSTYTVTPATLTVLGTWASQEMDVVGIVTGGWQFNASTTSTADNFVGYIIAKSTAGAASIAVADFEANGNAGLFNQGGTTTAAIRAGGGTGNGTRFEYDTSGGADMDAMRPGFQRRLYFRIDLPQSTTTGGAQSIKYVFTAGASS